jgi:hypothetical protein
MSQGGKRMVGGLWRGMVGRLDVRDALGLLVGYSILTY